MSETNSKSSTCLKYVIIMAIGLGSFDFGKNKAKK